MGHYIELATICIHLIGKQLTLYINENYFHVILVLRVEPIGPQNIYASSYGLCVLAHEFLQILPGKPASPESGKECGPVSYIRIQWPKTHSMSARKNACVWLNPVGNRVLDQKDHWSDPTELLICPYETPQSLIHTKKAEFRA